MDGTPNICDNIYVLNIFTNGLYTIFYPRTAQLMEPIDATRFALIRVAGSAVIDLFMIEGVP